MISFSRLKVYFFKEFCGSLMWCNINLSKRCVFLAAISVVSLKIVCNTHSVFPYILNRLTSVGQLTAAENIEVIFSSLLSFQCVL